MESFELRTFSPKEFAGVIGVSQSSIKRWVDAGLIDVSRTAGGHRRITLTEAVRFVRERKMPVLRPDLLGFSDLQGISYEAVETFTGDTLFELLSEKRMSESRGLVLASFLKAEPLGQIFDGPIRHALQRFGDVWRDSEDGIYQEHIATIAVVEAINQIRLVLSPPSEHLGLALGGAPEGDPHIIPTLMASTICASEGLREVNLGANTPVTAFEIAVERMRPTLVWIAAKSPLRSENRFEQLLRFLENARKKECAVVVGGHGAYLRRDEWPKSVTYLASMTDLSHYVAELTGQSQQQDDDRS